MRDEMLHWRREVDEVERAAYDRDLLEPGSPPTWLTYYTAGYAGLPQLFDASSVRRGRSERCLDAVRHEKAISFHTAAVYQVAHDWYVERVISVDEEEEEEEEEEEGEEEEVEEEDEEGEEEEG